MKRTIALLICLCLALSLLAGCGKSAADASGESDAPAAEETALPAEETAAAEEPAPEAADAAEDAEPAEVVSIGQGGSGFDTYPADTVVGTINGTDVTWMEYYYWLSYYTLYVQQFAAQYGVTLSAWDAYDLSGTDTNAQVVIMNAQQEVAQDHVIRTHAAAQGLELTPEDEAQLELVFDQTADSVTGDGDGAVTEEEIAAYEEYLASEMSVDRQFFHDFNAVTLLSLHSFEELYGTNGANLSDEDTVAFANENGPWNAKHILLTTIDTETQEPLSEEEITEKLAKAEDLYAQLAAVADDRDALVSLFDELMYANTEDPGIEYYPDGYVFSSGVMVEEFENAVRSLDIYGLSDIVESSSGYHIILRLPVDPDYAIGQDSEGNDVTLRYAVAQELFRNQLQDWVNAADIEWYEGFQEPDLAAIFG